MFLLFKVLDKKYKGMLMDKLFDMLNIMFLSDHLFELKHDDKYNIKLCKIVKKLIKKFMMDDFVVKIDKKTLSIVEKFNTLQKKHNAKCLKIEEISDSESSDSDSSDDESCDCDSRDDKSCDSDSGDDKKNKTKQKQKLI